MVPQSGPPVTRGSWVLSVPLHHTPFCLLLEDPFRVSLFFFFLFICHLHFSLFVFPSGFFPAPHKWATVSLHCMSFSSCPFSSNLIYDAWRASGVGSYDVWLLWLFLSALIWLSHKLLQYLAKLSFNYSVSFSCIFFLAHTSWLALVMAVLFCQIVSWLIALALVQTSLFPPYFSDLDFS